MLSLINKLKENHLVVGFASKTGLAVTRFLTRNNLSFSISDSKKLNEISDYLKQIAFAPKQVFAGKQDLSQLDGIQRIIIAPGVPRKIPLLQEALKRKIPIDTEIAFSLSLFDPSKRPYFIGITGTDGKSTTSALTKHLLEADFNTHLLGNFGEPLINQLENLKTEDKVVLELSSYQLEDAEKYHLNAASLLNIAADHLNRYDSIDSYRKAKEKIFYNQNNHDIAVLNMDNPFYEQWKNLTKARVITISFQNKKADLFYENGTVFCQAKPLITKEELKIKGSHNIENVMSATAFAIGLGISTEKIIQKLKSFEGLEHRSEYLGNIRGLHFINDSKATTIQSVQKSLTVTEDNIILILGGQDKSLDFTELNPFLDTRIKKIICYGEAAEKINNSLDFKNKSSVFEFDKAFNLALEAAEKGDTILLSPGCTSFDQFSSFEERGKHFKQLVKNYDTQTI